MAQLERIKFYADTPAGEKNKFFSFNCKYHYCMCFLLKLHKKGWIIRSVYYELLSHLDKHVLINKRIMSPQQWLNKYDHYGIQFFRYNPFLTCFEL